MLEAMVSSSPRDIREIKQELRTLLVDGRIALGGEERARRSARLTDAALSVLTPGATVAAYNPLGTEPGSGALLPALREVAAKILLPISGPEGELLWARDEGDEATAPGQLGVLEPTGPRRDWRALCDCDLILVPALGVTPGGMRIGKGAGYYDRALAHLYAQDTRPQVAVLLYSGEIRADIPVEVHDMPVDLIITDEGVSAAARD